MKRATSSCYINYFDVVLIGHAAHVDPDKNSLLASRGHLG